MSATPFELVELERRGVDGKLLKGMAKSLDLPAQRLFDILGIAKATAEKKAAAGQSLTGQGGHAALGMVKLLAQAQHIVDDSLQGSADNPTGVFDTAKWLGQWIETPLPALGHRKPAEFLDTPTGFALVSRMLGALSSGAYQ